MLLEKERDGKDGCGDCLYIYHRDFEYLFMLQKEEIQANADRQLLSDQLLAAADTNNCKWKNPP